MILNRKLSPSYCIGKLLENGYSNEQIKEYVKKAYEDGEIKIERIIDELIYNTERNKQYKKAIDEVTKATYFL